MIKSDELSKYFVNSAQSLPNRVQPKPVVLMIMNT